MYKVQKNIVSVENKQKKIIYSSIYSTKSNRFKEYGNYYKVL